MKNDNYVVKLNVTTLNYSVFINEKLLEDFLIMAK